ncbi:hydroxyphenylacetyl-CoA thioesterase PaaI [Nocardioides sp. AX2bis]|uniref:hydroxyphenylacetyl-CoA thioesterase PaaI n=1 Tax=Nocardioides sp. AX2bis TaxID=2653157 RepID=UPI0012F00F50|nr:hydroxyphenylacetyl-CoA thioesterase PaaI [Nocardioides sp. AX2bis]VXB88799.1 phenylacetate pathway hotdog-fold thioesterase [Nocardioides sp. AX2bis]
MPDGTRADAEEEVARLSTEAMWAGDAASRMLGMEVTASGPGTASVTMTVREDMVNGWGTCHGGLLATLADSAFAVACNSRGTVTVAAGFDVVFLEPGRLGDELVATAREVVLRGRSGIFDVRVARSADGATIAEFRGRSRSTGRPSPALSDPPPS